MGRTQQKGYLSSPCHNGCCSFFKRLNVTVIDIRNANACICWHLGFHWRVYQIPCSPERLLGWPPGGLWQGGPGVLGIKALTRRTWNWYIPCRIRMCQNLWRCLYCFIISFSLREGKVCLKCCIDFLALFGGSEKVGVQL